MKKYFSGTVRYAPGIIISVLFLAMLISPKTVFTGAQDGLLLWFRIVFPTLFPFILISNLLLEYGGLKIISRLFGRWIGAFFSVSGNGTFAVLAGFLCGYPMGAKVTADLLRGEKITETEAAYLLSFCNNTSPVFIINYIVGNGLKDEKLLFPSLFILFSVPVLFSFIFRSIYKTKGYAAKISSSEKKIGKAGEKKENIHISRGSVFDTCMMNGFESIVKVGGYIIFFSILISLVRNTVANQAAVVFIMPFLEITNGVLMIADSGMDLNTAFPFIMGISAFGGFCSAAQTSCMIKGTGLSITPYIIQKLAAAAAASLMAYCYIIIT